MPRHLRQASVSVRRSLPHEDLQQASPEEARCTKASHLQQPLSLRLAALVKRADQRNLFRADVQDRKTALTQSRNTESLARLPGAGPARANHWPGLFLEMAQSYCDKSQ